MASRHDNRIEFSKATKTLIAQRAGYRCSFPSCDRLTIGPGVEVSNPLCVGIAAHIHSAAPNGPRGFGGLTKDQLRAPTNGIWLCPTHAALIDKNEGIEYHSRDLYLYKVMHENRIAQELRGSSGAPKWIKEIRVISSPIFVRMSKIELERLTFIVGLNGSGKTALCEWIASSVNPHYLERWSTVLKGRDRPHIEVEFNHFGLHTATVYFARKDRPEYRLDSDTTLIPTAPLRIIFPRTMPSIGYDVEPNDISLIAGLMNLHPYEIRGLCEELNAARSGYFKETYLDDDDDTCMLFVREEKSNSKYPVPFRLLGDSTCARFLMELGILAGKKLSDRFPTILLLDPDFYRLDRNWANRYIELLVSPENGFQTIITIGPDRVDFEKIKWIGWNVFRLHGRPPNVTVCEGSLAAK